MKRVLKQVMALGLAFAMLSGLVVMPVNAAKKVIVKNVTVKNVKNKRVTLKVGKSLKLKVVVKVKPNKSANKKVTYKTSNKKVAKVSKAGKIKAVKKGKAVITITSVKDKKKKVKVRVTVTKASKNKPAPSVAPSKVPTATVSPSPTPEPTPSYYDWMTDPSIKELYKDNFIMGVAVSDSELRYGQEAAFVKYHFGSVTMSNGFKMDSLIKGPETQENFDNGIQRFVFDKELLDRELSYCVANGLKMRFHTFVWHAQNRNYMFYKSSSDETLVSKEVMNERLEYYIKDVIDYCETKYPGVIYAYDIVNEAVSDGGNASDYMRKSGSKWYDIYQSNEFIINAFQYGHEAIVKNNSSALLFYNDYNEYTANKQAGIIQLFKDINANEKICDGVGMQCHISTNNSITEYSAAIDKYAEAGCEVQITEMDVGLTNSQMVAWEDGKEDIAKQEAAFQSQGVFYKNFMKMLQTKSCITSVTIWGISDQNSWIASRPLLFDGIMGTIKPSFYGMLQDDSI